MTISAGIRGRREYPALDEPRAAAPVLISREYGMERLMRGRFREPLGVPRASVQVEMNGWDHGRIGFWRRGGPFLLSPQQDLELVFRATLYTVLICEPEGGVP